MILKIGFKQSVIFPILDFGEKYDQLDGFYEICVFWNPGKSRQHNVWRYTKKNTDEPINFP